MGSFRQILAATDFSEDARQAAFRAAILAHEHGAGLELLHVVTESSVRTLESFAGMPTDISARLTGEAGAALAALATDISRRYGIEPTIRTAMGDPADTIAAMAENADLLAMGPRGAGGLRDLFLGAVTDRVLRRSSGPVLVVKRPPDEPYARVLVPVAFGPHSAGALQTALLLAPDAETTVFHAFIVPYEASLSLAGLRDDQVRAYRETARAAAMAGVEELLTGLGVGGVRVRRSVEGGESVPLILAKAAELESDLVVIGRRGRGPVEEFFLGSVTRHILSGSPADVLIVGARPDRRPASTA